MDRLANDPDVRRAAEFATKAHEGQTRKYNGRPYITHPARVAAKVCQLPTATKPMAMAAWLHDVVEDCNIPLKQLESTFGPEVSTIVEGLTNRSKQLYPKLNRAGRKQKDLERLAETGWEVQTIKAIDRIDNLSELDDLDFMAVYLRESEALLGVLTKADDLVKIELSGLLTRLSHCVHQD